MPTRLLALLVAAVALIAAPLVAVVGSTPAGAVSPGPVQITLVAGSPPGATCPNGTYVAVSPGPTQSPVFVLISPGPVNCPQGSDVLVSPGPIGAPAPTGQAVALPVTAKSCVAGTALLDQELTMLGSGTPGGLAPTHKASRRVAGCPSGDAALAALQAALANVPVGQGGTGFLTPGSFGLPAVQRGFVTVDPGPIQAPSLVLSGFSSFTDTFIDIPVNGTGPTHQVVDFRFSHSGIAKVKLVQFSPVVTTQPVSKSAPEGSFLTFTAKAIGNPFPTVLWQVSEDGGTNWMDATLGSTFLTSTTLDTGTLYSFENGWEVRAVFTNSLGTATSDPATITVTP